VISEKVSPWIMNPKAKVSKIDTSKVMDIHKGNEQATSKVTP